MEYVEGETLQDLIKRSGPLEVKLALEIATQVASGLAAVHKQKLVHRDIKPSNIMVTFEEGGAVTAKIIDLGLAKAVNEPGSQTAISLGDGDRPCGVQRFPWGGDVSASACAATARTT